MSADVVVENYRQGALARRGLTPHEILAANAGLIWCTVSGFGRESNRPGYDFIVQAEAGWMAITGDPDGEPMKVGIALADVLAGKDAVAAILAALTARARGSLGSSTAARHLSVSLLHSAATALVNVAQNALVSGKEAARWGNAHANLCPYQLFRTADAPIVIAVGSDAQWKDCALALGLDDLAGDTALAANAGRLGERARIVAAFERALSEHGADHWIDRLQRSDVPCGRVKRVSDAVRELGGSAETGMPPLDHGRVRFPPPRLDAHTSLVRSQGWEAFRTLAASEVEH
jgi:crotonobetainyl-CoA:carnitine CoA-transferase CaiB-like acyl-CoA transferase